MDHSQLFSAEAPGLVVIGTEHSCGKTVVGVGIAAALREQGYSTRMIKPILLGSRRKSEPELNFITSVSQTPLNYPLLFLDRPTSIHETNWQNTILFSRAQGVITIIELPGAAASPVCFDETNVGTLASTWRDASDLAMEFQQPCLLVAKHQSDSIERLVSNAFYLTERGLKVVGMVTCETLPEAGADLEAKQSRNGFSEGLYQRTKVPYLGCLKFSPTISVPKVNQGNITKLASSGLDLKGLLRSIQEMVVSV